MGGVGLILAGDLVGGLMPVGVGDGDGVAEGECMTCSVGFRAATATGLAQELLHGIADDLEAPEADATGRAAETIYRDPRQPATATPGRLPDSLLDRWHYHAEESLAHGRADRSSIYGGFHPVPLLLVALVGKDGGVEIPVPGVAEVASIGGMVKQYQVVVDPQKLAAYGVTASEVGEALKRANQETGGASVEMAGAEYTVRASGYLKTLDDFRAIPLVSRAGMA